MADLTWEQLTILVDSREQHPWSFGDMRTEVASLPTGDYSVKHLEHVIAVERKSLPDLVACCGRERERFSREIDRLRGYATKAVIVEASWSELEFGQWSSKLTPQQVVGSVCGWMATAGIPFIMAHRPERAAQLAARIMFLAARRRYREAAALLASDALEAQKL